MTATSPRDGSRAAAVCAALAPYSWRNFTPERLARLVLAAHDRHALMGVLGAVAGADVGPWAPPEPADATDPRLPALVEFLSSHRWTELTLRNLCVRLLAVLHEPT
jgi:hypothetical protein